MTLRKLYILCSHSIFIVIFLAGSKGNCNRFLFLPPTWRIASTVVMCTFWVASKYFV